MNLGIFISAVRRGRTLSASITLMRLEVVLKHDEELKVIFFLGTAGSGKSTMASAAKDWFLGSGAHAMVANLDPGAERLPYMPDVDVRDYVMLDEVMDRYGLGPNGAMVVSADLIAEDFGEVYQEIESLEPDYLLVDTPGQLELFVFRASGAFVVKALSKEQTLAAFLVDPFLTQTPSSLVSILLLSATAELRLGVPVLRVLSKSDILTEEQIETVREWTTNPDSLYGDLVQETGPTSSLTTRLCSVLVEAEESFKLTMISAKERRGFEDLYSEVQFAYEGGEDFIVPEP